MAIHGHRSTRMWLAGGILAVSIVGIAVPGTGSASASSPSKKVVLRNARLFDSAHFDYVNCNVQGTSTSTIANSNAAVYYLAKWSGGQGNHKFGSRWYSPDGKLYYKGSFRDSNITSSCGGLNIVGTTAAEKLGLWTLRLLIDGHVVGSRTFTLTLNSITTNSATTIPCDIDKCALNVQGTGNVDGTKDQTLVFQGPSSFKVYYLWSCFGSQAPGLQATLLGFDNNTALTVSNGELPGGSKLIVSNTKIRENYSETETFQNQHTWTLRVQSACAWTIEVVPA